MKNWPIFWKLLNISARNRQTKRLARQMSSSGQFPISGVSLLPLTQSSDYLKPYKFTFTQDGIQRQWHLMFSHDSVACLLYHSDKKALVFVKQFRPAVYTNRVMNEFEEGERIKSGNSIDWSKYPSSLGVTHELCAGIVDKADTSLQEIMRQEIMEECGYDVAIESIQKITSFRGHVGTSGGKQTLFYAELNESMKVNGKGGGDPTESEMIDVVYVPLEGALAFAMDESVMRPPTLLLAVTWFYANKHPSLLRGDN